MKILITNAYSSRNKGDAAILFGMLADLGSQEAFRGAEFRISTADYPGDASAYPCAVVESFHSLKQRFTRYRWAQCLGFLLLILPWSLLWAWAWGQWHLDLWAPRPWRKLFRQYAEADLVVAAGGGYLYTRSAWRGNLMLLITVFSFRFASLLGRPVSLYSQSIGPFQTKFQAAFVRCALRDVRPILVREEISMELVASWQLQGPVRMTGDAAFLLPPTTECDLPFRLPSSPRRVGITVRKWSKGREEQERFERTIAQFIDRIAASGETLVVLIPQVTFAAWEDDDREVMRRLHAQVHARDRVVLVENDLSPLQVKALCGAMDFFVGTRMHSNIFALSMGVPTIAIGYLPKSTGIMRQLGLGRWVISWEDIALQPLQAAFEDLVQSADEVRTELSKKIPEVVRSASLNGRWIAEDYIAGVTRPSWP
jgi:colanic acid/amylovoran biosynthesis protein